MCGNRRFGLNGPSKASTGFLLIDDISANIQRGRIFQSEESCTHLEIDSLQLTLSPKGFAVFFARQGPDFFIVYAEASTGCGGTDGTLDYPNFLQFQSYYYYLLVWCHSNSDSSSTYKSHGIHPGTHWALSTDP
jgi:hypothetical protein